MKGVASPPSASVPSAAEARAPLARSQVLPEIVLLPGYCGPPLVPSRIWKSPPVGCGRAVGLAGSGVVWGCELNCQSLISPSRGRAGHYPHELCAARLRRSRGRPLPHQIRISSQDLALHSILP